MMICRTVLPRLICLASNLCFDVCWSRRDRRRDSRVASMRRRPTRQRGGSVVRGALWSSPTAQPQHGTIMPVRYLLVISSIPPVLAGGGFELFSFSARGIVHRPDDSLAVVDQQIAADPEALSRGDLATAT